MTAPAVNVCGVEGCEKPKRGRKHPWCEMHYARYRRRGTVERWRPEGKLRHSGGYLLVYAPDHPLAKRHTSPREYEHRIVFYDAHGEGPFACHWCGGTVGWDDMHVDHLNDTPDDNRLENLVASCATCNQKRGRKKMARTMRRRHGRLIEFNGMRKTLGEWAASIGISRQSLASRLSSGWPLERALTQPRGNSGPRSRRLNQDGDR